MMKKYLFAVVFLILSAAIIFSINIFINVSNKRECDKYINIVKNYYNEDYNNVSYGQAFDKFFILPEWEYFNVKDKNVVKFSGGFMYDDVETIIKVYFEVNENEEKNKVQIKYMFFNEKLQDNLTQAALLSRVFESY